MSYSSLALLTTPDDCDVVLADTHFQLRQLRHQLEGLAIAQLKADRRLLALDISLARTQAELDSLVRIAPTVSPWLRHELAIRLRRATSRRDALRCRHQQGGIAALRRELACRKVQVHIDELATLATAVAAHQASLTGARPTALPPAPALAAPVPPAPGRAGRPAGSLFQHLRPKVLKQPRHVFRVGLGQGQALNGFAPGRVAPRRQLRKRLPLRRGQRCQV
jgi:hypothetical protein